MGVGPIGHHIETDRLGERDHVRRNRYAHVVTSALQLPADDGARLNIAPTPIRGQYNSHQLNLTRGPRRVWPHLHRYAQRQHRDIILQT